MPLAQLRAANASKTRSTRVFACAGLVGAGVLAPRASGHVLGAHTSRGRAPRRTLRGAHKGWAERAQLELSQLAAEMVYVDMVKAEAAGSR